MDTASLVNKYVFKTAPWQSAKTDFAKAEKDMFVIMNAVKNLNVLFSPFLPHASQKVHAMLGGEAELASQPHSRELTNNPDFKVLSGDYESNRDHWKFTAITAGQRIGRLEGHLFQKLDENDLQTRFDAIVTKRTLGKTAISHS
jgi:methionyl-tRNA synthetase